MADDINVVSFQEQKQDVREWLSEVFDTSQDQDDRADMVCDRLDDLLLASKFEEVDVIFDVLVEEFMSEAFEELSISLGFLMVSNGGQDRLPSRRTFYDELVAYVDKHTEHTVSAMFGSLG